MSAVEPSTVAQNAASHRRKVGAKAVGLALFTGLMLMMIGGAGYFGARAGLSERQAVEESAQIKNRDAYALTRFERGIAAYGSGNLALAQSNFELALQFQPSNRSAKELLATTQAIQTRVVLPTPTIVPTLPPDRGKQIEVLQTVVTRKEWDTVVIVGMQLRAISATLTTAERTTVDDALFKAYSTRGFQRLGRGELEAGLFDLDLATAIRPLEQGQEIERYLTSLYQSALYVYGADWEKSIERFKQIYTLSPRFRDVAQRLFESYKRAGDTMAELQDWCTAEKRYAGALQLFKTSELEQKLLNMQQSCANGGGVSSAPAAASTPMASGTSIGGNIFYNAGGFWYRTDGVSILRVANPFSTVGAWATFSPDRRRVAYVQNGTIYIVPNTGGTPAPLVAGTYPSWGPTGQIVFQGCFNSSCGLHVINPDSPGQVLRLSNSAADIAPRWSPHGGEIAYMSNQDGAWEIYTVTMSGQFRRLTSFRASSGLPVWSPDGGRIAFVSNKDGVWALYVMYADGSNVRKVADLGATAPSWQNDRLAWFP
ncbi:MAG: PD40 domain-containing protein [Anaerolineae bacterium]|nr:PD40 domain-containing protein [Anaerolineae bacterium]